MRHCTPTLTMMAAEMGRSTEATVQQQDYDLAGTQHVGCSARLLVREPPS
jgi:hypothetical protein